VIRNVGKRDGELRITRWLRALAIAKILFEDQGYHNVALLLHRRLINTQIVLDILYAPDLAR